MNVSDFELADEPWPVICGRYSLLKLAASATLAVDVDGDPIVIPSILTLAPALLA